MNRSRREIIRSLAGGGAVLIFFGGCKKPGGGVAATRPAGGATPPRPPAALPATSRLVIDGFGVTFPAAHLRVQGTSPLSMALYSDQAGQGASTFYIDITIDGVDDVSMLDGAVWQMMAADDRTDDLLTTIQLDGGARQLQPQDVTILFSSDGERVTAKLGGRWGLFTRADAVLPDRAVLVTGELVAAIEAQ